MQSNKKGTGKKPAPHTHTNLNTIENICLMLFGAFLILFIGGYYIHNEPMTYLGLGLGLAGFVIQIKLNLEEE